MLQNRLHGFVARLTVPQRIDFYCPSRKAIPYDVNKQVSTYKFSKLCCTVILTFPWDILLKGQYTFPLVITVLILIIFSLDYILILLRESLCGSFPCLKRWTDTAKVFADGKFDCIIQDITRS